MGSDKLGSLTRKKWDFQIFLYDDKWTQESKIYLSHPIETLRVKDITEQASKMKDDMYGQWEWAP